MGLADNIPGGLLNGAPCPDAAAYDAVRVIAADASARAVAASALRLLQRRIARRRLFLQQPQLRLQLADLRLDRRELRSVLGKRRMSADQSAGKHGGDGEARAPRASEAAQNGSKLRLHWDRNLRWMAWKALVAVENERSGSKSKPSPEWTPPLATVNELQHRD